MTDNKLLIPSVGLTPDSAERVTALLDENGVPFVDVNILNWPNDYPYAPLVKARLAHTDNAILVEYCVVEDAVCAAAQHDNDPVYKDACCEFFCAPVSDGTYYNFETNCAGTLLMEYGTGRDNREKAPEGVLRLVKRAPSLGRQPFTLRRQPTQWSLALIIPLSAFFHHHLTMTSGLVMRANIYKCGDMLPQPHYLSLFPINTSNPDFHRPEFFGTIVME